MQKVQKDPSLARYYHKTAFDVPVGYELNLNCDGSGEVVADDGMTDVVKDDFEEEMENYFE